MTTLQVQAIITAVDRLTGPLQAMASKVAAVDKRFRAASGGVASFAASTGAAGAGIGAFALAGQQELDAQLRKFQIVGNVTADQRKQLEALVHDIGPRLGVQQLDLITGAKDAAGAGLEFSDLMARNAKGVTMLERLAAVGEAGDSKLGDMVVDMVSLAKQFNMPWDTAEEKLKTIEKLSGIAAVAPRLSPDTARGHIAALAQFGAVGQQMGMSIEDASTLQNVLSKSGFRDGSGGYALKSFLQRLMNPTFGGQQQMELAGFDYGKVFKTDVGSLDPKAFSKALGVVGIDVRKHEGLIANAIKKGDGGNILGWKTDLNQDLASAMGLKKGAVQERGMIKRAIDNVVATKTGGFDTLALLKELSKLPASAFKDIAGLHHSIKAAVLKFESQQGEYQAIKKSLTDQAPTAVDEGLKIRTEGFDASIRKLTASFTKFQSALMGAGVGDMLTSLFNSLASGLDRLSGMDPANLELLAKSLTAIGVGAAGLGAAGAAILLMAPAVRALAVAGTLLFASPMGRLLLGAVAVGAVAGQFGALRGEMESLQALVTRLNALDFKGVMGWLAGKDAAGNLPKSPLLDLLKPKDAPTAPSTGTMEGFGIPDPSGLGDGSAIVQRLNSPLDVRMTDMPEMKGRGTVSVTVKVEGPGKVTGMSASDDGKNVKLKTGESMSDTNK